MSQRKKKDDKDDKSSDNSLGASIAAGAAVVGFAALTYGAWKLYDFLSSSSSEGATSSDKVAKAAKKIPESNAEEDISSPVRRITKIYNEDHHCPNASSNSLPSKVEISLATQLLTYYHNYVEVQPNEMREAMKIVKQIKMQLSKHLMINKKLQELHICQIEDTGSSTDGLIVIVPETFDVLIPFQLNSDECYIDLQGPESQFSSVLVKLTSDAWSDVTDDKKYIIPAKFIELLKQDFINAVYHCKNDCLKPMIHETSLAVNVCHGVKKFTINFVPALKIDARVFLTEVPAAVNMSDCHWRESFGLQETQNLNHFGSGVSGHKIILKIFKAIRLNFPLQFGLLSSYHYKTILFHLKDFQMDESDWELSAISERFIDFLIELGSCLKERNLPHYFLPRCNLIDEVSPEISEKLAHFVNQIVGHQDISKLLKYDYP